jgi:hypothetical protein
MLSGVRRPRPLRTCTALCTNFCSIRRYVPSVKCSFSQYGLSFDLAKDASAHFRLRSSNSSLLAPVALSPTPLDITGASETDTVVGPTLLATGFLTLCLSVGYLNGADDRDCVEQGLLLRMLVTTLVEGTELPRAFNNRSCCSWPSNNDAVGAPYLTLSFLDTLLGFLYSDHV